MPGFDAASPQVDVVIVGAGPVGLAAAIETATRGLRVLVAERNDRAGTAPRAKTTNVRTRTHLRRWGIAGDLAAAAPFGVDYPNNMVFVTRLGPQGHELTRFADAFNAAPARSPLYPEHAQWVPQYTLEKVLLGKVRTLAAADVRFDTAFVTATQDEHGVVSTLEDGAGRRLTVRSRYLIGADGSRSTVRDLIGARMAGRHALSRNYNIIFRAPGLAATHRFGPAAAYWQIGRNGFSGIGPMDRNDTWFFMPAIPAGRTLTMAEAGDLIRERTGIDRDYEILSADMWTANELLADRYAERRIILAGDACHLHPPFGGYGMNMGVGDAVDLGWKIAATLKGWGGPGLVASYEAERRPVHRAVIEEAVGNHGSNLVAPPAELEDDTAAGAAARARFGSHLHATKGREFHTLGTVLGLGYENSPIVVAEGGPPPPRDSQTYVPTARPGYLAPHSWLEDGRSLYDCFGDGFALIVADTADAAEVAQATGQAEALGVPITVVRPRGVAVETLYGAALALVRPDQHVAWRGDRWDGALSRATGRSPAA